MTYKSNTIEGYTVWVCELDHMGQIRGTHHVSYHVGTPYEAKAAAIEQTRDDWQEYDFEPHILGVARGNVELIEWDEGAL